MRWKAMQPSTVSWTRKSLGYSLRFFSRARARMDAEPMTSILRARKDWE